MKNNKRILLALDDELYYKIKKSAEAKHIPLSTYVKLCMVELLEDGGNIDGSK